MKRFWIACTTLLLLFFLSFAGNMLIQKSADDLNARLERVILCSEQEFFGAAKEEAEDAKSAYEKAEPLLMLCIKSDVLEEIEAQLIVLPVYAGHKEGVHLTAEAKKAIALIAQLKETEKFSFINVF